ncbi:hypothetical protein [Streptomyces sp. NPDC001744]|uniref:hypothetical protein n=1 Tax=Streptomyces sp. NPDC001744 TaxID=3364606 RepID=UPI0036976165
MNGPPASRSALSALKLGFEAFREANRGAYVRYAEKWTGDPAEAERCVEAVLDALESRWVGVLGSDSPAARVWEELRAEAARRSADSGGRTRRFHTALRDDQADVVLLHHDLGLSVEHAAHLMGLDVPDARALLRGAERDLRAESDR